MKQSDESAPRTFSLQVPGNPWFAAVFAVICVAFALTAAWTEGGPWHGLAQFTGVLAYLYALRIDVKAQS